MTRGSLRPVALALLALAPAAGLGQAPDIRARLDLAISFDYRKGEDRTARTYTPLGRPSIVGLTAILESGYNVYVAERLGRLPHDSQADLLDEAYVEDPGILRIGKQYVPFGTGRLLHDSVPALRIDSNLIAEGVPVSLLACGGGHGDPKGIVLRIGRSVAASLAVGEHFGIAPTSLGVVRPPSDAPGRGGGWRQAVGADASHRLGKLALSGEFATFGGGPDRTLTVFDFESSYAFDGYHSAGAGYSHTTGGTRGTDFIRLFGRVHASRNVDLEPLVRLRQGRLLDAAVTLRLRL